MGPLFDWSGYDGHAQHLMARQDFESAIRLKLKDGAAQYLRGVVNVKRYQMVTKCKEWPDGPEKWTEIIEQDNGPLCYYDEANAIIGDLRKRLERANQGLQRASYGARSGYDERKFN